MIDACRNAIVILLAATLPLAAAHAQTLAELRAGAATPARRYANAAGMLQFCIDNHRLGDDAARLEDAFIQKLGGDVSTNGEFLNGSKGHVLIATLNQTINLDEMLADQKDPDQKARSMDQICDSAMSRAAELAGKQ